MQWTPNPGQIGSRAVRVRVTDSTGLFAVQSFTIDVANVNDAPSFISTPSLVGNQDQEYSYSILLADPDPGDLLFVTLEVVPVGMGVNPQTGEIQWTPTANQVGDNTVSLRVVDLGGLFQFQDFTIAVANVNDAPVIVSTADTTAATERAYGYQVMVSDPDLPFGEVLTFSLNPSPEGMTIDSLGQIEWTPQISQEGDHDVTVRVEDAEGSSDTQSFTITVVIPNRSPIADAGPDQEVAVGTTVILDGRGSSECRRRSSNLWLGDDVAANGQRRRPFGSHCGPADLCSRRSRYL